MTAPPTQVRVAVVAPVSHAAAMFPHVLDRGLKTLQAFLEDTLKVTVAGGTLKTTVYPSCYGEQVFDAVGKQIEGPGGVKALPPKARAEELRSCLFNSTSSYDFVFCTVGGEDSIRLLPFLEELDIDSPADGGKATKFPDFFGYSAQTDVHLVLWRYKIPSYYGGAILCQFALSSDETVEGHTALTPLLPLTRRSLEACVRKVWHEVERCDYFVPDYHNWFDKEAQVTKQPRHQSAPKWEFVHVGSNGIVDSDEMTLKPTGVRRGILFGGCCEVLYSHMAARGVKDFKRLDRENEKLVLFLETSEQLPPDWLLVDLIRAMGQQRILEKVSCVLVALPKLEFLGEKAGEKYAQKQRDAIVKALAEWIAEDRFGVDVDRNCQEMDAVTDSVPVVFNIHAGHVDPQTVVPMGREAVVDLGKEQIFFNCGAEESFEEYQQREMESVHM
eukprot:CAMPEP_0169229362 /NCGR_PEP_ID=MMETSP1016-20121227/25349_1 /TAXON_ID=342587 /ORGANISM="Karlodinium micrum, Strain CCMP2283" /LENGTH=443 /DNA_ID=CAMNT_0009308247 /DNA_START=47 /DNA_END=1378 /DNA_ORIENTATION=-